MIEHLTGTIIHKQEDRVVLDVGGVGYGVAGPERTIRSLGAEGSEASLWIKTYVAEGELSLYGFALRAEREVFEVFLGISGVGPRLALAILSIFDIGQILEIVASADAQRLRKVPGIGLKKAEKLMLELKGRLARLAAGIGPERLAALGSSAPGEALLAELGTEAARDAAQALEALGVTPATARRAIAKALQIAGESAPAEELVREGLRHRHAV